MQINTTKTGYLIQSEALNWINKWDKDGCKEISDNKIYCTNTKNKISWYPPLSDGNPWCSAFVSTVVKSVSDKLGYTSKHKFTASTKDWQNSKLHRNTEPAVGSVFFRKSKGGSSYGHVGIIVGWDDKYVYTVEGNAGNKIKMVKYTWWQFQNGTKSFSNFIVIHTELEGDQTKVIAQDVTGASSSKSIVEGNDNDINEGLTRNFFVRQIYR